MTNKFFMWLAGAVLLAALGVGVAFAGGVAYERSGADTSPVVTAPDLPSPSGAQGQPGGGRFNSEAIADLQARLQSGSATPEDLQQLRQQFAGQGGGFGGDGGAGGNLRFGGGGLNGPIESIEGDTVTINTPQGPLQVMLNADTTINNIVEIDASALTVETRISVNGQRNEAGVMEATTITITPEGYATGRGGGFQRGFGGQAQSSGQ